MRGHLVVLLATVFGPSSPGTPAAGPEPARALVVVRLRPGDERYVEVALPVGQFRPAGQSVRSMLSVSLFPEKPGGEFRPVPLGRPTGQEHFKAGPHRVAGGVDLRWSAGRPGVEFHADRDARAVTQDVRVTYSNFGGKDHAVDFRVVVAAE
jgi:hypothetical protein